MHSLDGAIDDGDDVDLIGALIGDVIAARCRRQEDQ